MDKRQNNLVLALEYRGASKMYDGDSNIIDTETTRKSGNQVCDQDIQIESRFPSTKVVNELADDYRDFTELMMKLDVEIGTFTDHMRLIQNNMTDFEGLKILWDEQVKTIDHETKEFQMDTTNPDTAIMEKLND